MTWKLSDLLQKANLHVPVSQPGLILSGLTDNSSRVEPGAIFVAIRGSERDGHAFISDAVEKGARAVVVEQEIPPYEGVEILKVPDSKEALGALAHAWYGNPTAHMLVFGVSGTNGKTTTTYLLESICTAAGVSAGVVGTIEYRFANQRESASNTTPSALVLAELFSRMRRHGVAAVAMEVSSHAAHQKRIAGIEFDVGILTNITQDHLDYHGTMEAYAAAKRSFYFDFLLRPRTKATEPWAVFNINDAWGQRFATDFPAAKLTYGLQEGAMFYPLDLQLDARGIRFRLVAPDGTQLNIVSPLLGYFNVFNILGAVAAAYAAGFDPRAIERGVQALTDVPGRFERIDIGQPFAVIVDYAHTPDALQRVLDNARRMTPNGRIITVFGCGGERDPTKRPVMGEIVASLSDYVVVTNDNPRREDPERIASMIVEGIKRTTLPDGSWRILLDRREAIAHAFDVARKGDCVLIAGKGAEPYIDIGGVKIPYDDRETARALLRERYDRLGRKRPRRNISA
ncbi:MAG: UDP-N-acetylmuramoyl-L-alanyl-D-glutamate--2,6-diaminopimelate ligase [Candidatus Sumerlaeaceae bacterium]|nr:UDP-N-acetylmuramoyl-L-alanyl-D-glutamate--2,6-diaminopimelate ligase [Candidatus Sumerlaeaceae bacterium]